MDSPRSPRPTVTTKTIAITREVVDELTQAAPSMPERIRNWGASRRDVEKRTRRETLSIVMRLETTTGSPSNIPPSVN